jgi:hypothetical protein
MQENSGGQNKIPIHKNQLESLNEHDIVKSVKTTLKNVMKTEEVINENNIMEKICNAFGSKTKSIKTIQPSSFTDALNNTIYDVNNIVTNVCNFINAFVLNEFQKTKSITTITIDYIILAMKTVSKRSTTGRPTINTTGNKFNDFFNNYFKKTMTDENYSYDDKLSFNLKYEAIDILKNIEVNITEHYIDHLYKFVNVYFELRKKFEELKKINNINAKNEATRLMFKELNEIKNDLIQNETNLNNLKFSCPSKHHNWIKKVKHQLMPNKKFAKDSIHYDVKVNPQKYLGHMIWINEQFQKWSTKEDTIKLFHILPLRSSFIPKHVTFDTAGLISIFNDCGGNKELFKNINKNKKEVWNKYFKMDTQIFRKKGYDFYYVIKTDGVSVSIIFVKKDKKNKKGRIKTYTKSEIKEIEKEKKINEDAYIEDMSIEGINKLFENKSYICIDPNYGDLIHGVVGNFHNDAIVFGTTFNYTRNQRRKECKVTKYKNIRKDMTNKKIKMDPKSEISLLIGKIKKDKTQINEATIMEIQTVLSQFNSKTCDTKKFLEYVKYKNKIHLLIKDVYREEIFRKLKMNVYINTQKSESKMMTNFKEKIGEPENVIIIYGDYDDKNTQVKGKEPIVSKRLRRVFRENRYRVLLINEYNTSALCNICCQKTESCKTRISKKPKYKEKNHIEEVWGLRRCSNLNCKVTTKKGVLCRRVYNRDDNACMNMIKIVEHIKKHGTRPPLYCYTKKEDNNNEEDEKPKKKLKKNSC